MSEFYFIFVGEIVFVGLFFWMDICSGSFGFFFGFLLLVDKVFGDGIEIVVGLNFVYDGRYIIFGGIENGFNENLEG